MAVTRRGRNASRLLSTCVVVRLTSFADTETSSSISSHWSVNLSAGVVKQLIYLSRLADKNQCFIICFVLRVDADLMSAIGFTFLVPADLGSPGKRAVNRARMCVRFSLAVKMNGVINC